MLLAARFMFGLDNTYLFGILWLQSISDQFFLTLFQEAALARTLYLEFLSVRKDLQSPESHSATTSAGMRQECP